MKIPFCKPDLTEKEAQAVLKVVRGGYITRGQETMEFEKSFAEFHDKKYAVAVNNGTNALHLIVKSMGLKAGDEVITTPFSFIASSNCLLMEGVNPIFVDIDRETYNMDPGKIKDKITEKTKAILPVDVFGVPCEMDKIKHIADENNLKVIEDSCEAFGAQYKGAPIGKYADAMAFSFFPNKQITTGEGGMIVTDNEDIYRASRSLRNQGRNPEEGEWLRYERMGYNCWMTEMSAAMGNVQLSRLEEILGKRKIVADRYIEGLSKIEGIKMPVGSGDPNFSWFNFVVRVDEKNRNKAIGYLREKGIPAKEYFPSIHLEEFCEREFELGYKNADFPICEKISSETINLPFYGDMTKEEHGYVIRNLENAIKDHG